MFNKIVKHLLKQNKKCELTNKNDYKMCVYRGENGMKCAIGCILPDKLYRPRHDKESYDIYRLMNNLEIRKYFGGKDNIEFLVELQGIHDSYNPKNWKFKLKIFAKKYDLKFPG